MKYKIIIGISILLFGVGTYFILNTKENDFEIVIQEVDIISLAEKEDNQNGIIDIVEVEETNNISSINNNESISSNVNDAKSIINNNDNSNSISSDNNNLVNNNIEQTNNNSISNVLLWDWLINDFPVSKYGNRETAFNECDKKGEEYIENYNYFCTDVNNIDGIFVGYMLRLKEHNTGDDYNWHQ